MHLSANSPCRPLTVCGTCRLVVPTSSCFRSPPNDQVLANPPQLTPRPYTPPCRTALGTHGLLIHSVITAELTPSRNQFYTHTHLANPPANPSISPGRTRRPAIPRGRCRADPQPPRPAAVGTRGGAAGGHTQLRVPLRARGLPGRGLKGGLGGGLGAWGTHTASGTTPCTWINGAWVNGGWGGGTGDTLLRVPLAARGLTGRGFRECDCGQGDTCSLGAILRMWVNGAWLKEERSRVVAHTKLRRPLRACWFRGHGLRGSCGSTILGQLPATPCVPGHSNTS